MKFLGIEWFKTQKEKELEDLKIKEQKLKNELLETQAKILNDSRSDVKTEGNINLKPYKTVKFVNNTLTVVLNDGDIITKIDATEEDFNKVRKAKDETEVFEIVIEKEVRREIEKNKKIIKGLELLKAFTDDFEFKGDSVYLKVNGKVINRSIPALVVERFIEIVQNNEENEQFQALKKFMLKCFANPNSHAAEDLYKFLTDHKFKIDRHGNFYAYRRVVSRNAQNKELVEFVSNTYTKVKAVWKKKPSDFFVYKTEDGYKIAKSIDKANSVEELGNLETLYLDLPNMQKKSYTSAHTGREDYRIGEIISMPRYEANDDNSVSCSKGFHGCNSKLYNYSSFGDTIALMAVNPIDVVAIPKSEAKFRTCRWFFAAVLDSTEEHILDEVDFDVTDLGDVFEEKCLENMQEYVQNSFAEEVKRHTFTLSGLSSTDVNLIVHSLKEMKETLDKRVVNLD